MSKNIIKVDGMFMWYEIDQPTQQSDSIAGTLEISESGVSTLSLVGLLSDGTPTRLSLGDKPISEGRLIFGSLKDSRYVVLGRIRSGGTTLGRVLSHQKFIARDAVIFRYLDEYPDLRSITKLEINIASLGEWASEPLIKVTATSQGPVAKADSSNALTFDLHNKSVRLKNSVSYIGPDEYSYRSVTLAQQTFWEVEPKIPIDLEGIRKEFRLFEDLVLLLADSNVVLPWPSICCGGKDAQYYFERRPVDSQQVEPFKSWASLHWRDIDLGELLSNLETAQDSLGPGLYLYLGIQRSPALYLENRFSTAIFGLESLHRRVGSSLAQTKLKDRISRILESIKDKDDNKWLKGRLKNASEPSLEERLFATFSELEIDLEPKSLRAFSKECASLRNEVAHFGGQRDGDYNDFVRRMISLNEAVRPLYHAVLLRRIGFSRERIWSYFHRSPYSTQRTRVFNAAGLSFKKSSPPNTPSRSDPDLN